jgi:hypothetical protein
VIKMGKGKNTTLYVPLAKAVDWEIFCKIESNHRNTAIMDFVSAQVAKFQGKDPGQASAVQVEALENEYKKVCREMSELVIPLKKTPAPKCKSVHEDGSWTRSMSDELYEFVAKLLGVKEPTFAKIGGDKILKTVYAYQLRGDEPFSDDQWHQYVFYLERVDKKYRLQAQIQKAWGKATTNLLLSSAIKAEPNEEQEEQNNNLKIKPESPVSHEKTNSSVQPEEEAILEEEEIENDDGDQEHDSNSYGQELNEEEEEEDLD